MTLQDNKILKTISALADQHKFEIYVVGGFVRDFFLQRERSEMDFVIVGDGIKFAELLAKHLHLPKPAVYRNFGTAMLKWDDMQLEFVGLCEATMRSKTSAEWLAIFDKFGVPAGPFKLVGELHDDEQVLANGMRVEIDHPVAGRLAMAVYQRFTFGYLARSISCHSKREIQGQVAISAIE